MKKVIRIGRLSSNDSVFQNPSVSSNHAVLTLNEDGQTGELRDLNSTNGTFVNNKRISQPMPVAKGDVIRLGSEITSLDDILSRQGKTMIRPNNNTPHNAITIGKNPENKIVINRDDVSRKHAILFKNSNGDVVIEDTNSTNGTYVNGIKITSQVLHSGDKVTITRNYPLNWEQYFSTSAQPEPVIPVRKKNKTGLFILLAASIAALIIGAIFLFKGKGTLDQKQIYDKYSNAVALVDIQYGYKIYLDGEDVTRDVMSLIIENDPTIQEICYNNNLKLSNYVFVYDGMILPGTAEATGTAFFISDDGKLVTNRHITRPWIDSKAVEADVIENMVEKIVTYLTTYNPAMARSNVKVEGVMLNMSIVLNGLPVTKGNMIECMEIAGSDQPEIDVAVIQTETRKLPSDNITIIDINNADDSEEAYTPGNQVYTIGFPYGTKYMGQVDINVDDNQNLVNQIHGGFVSQNKNNYQFSHDAATAGGASGSPILNDKGQLIGVHHAGMTGVTGAQGFNWGIKVKHVKDLLGIK